MASSLPLVTTGLRPPPPPPPASSSTPVDDDDDGHGSTHPNSGGRRNEGTLNWCSWAHQGHRLWVGMPDSFWVFTYKVERCPFPGNHTWMSCPYAHRGERARRRDPRVFAYAAEPCPEHAESRRRLQLAGSSAAPTCARGLRCGYAHGVFETWLHPTRFRTVMCDRGAGCPRRICFFAHCPAQRRREHDEVPLVVFPATQTRPPPPFVPRAPRPCPAAAAASSSRSRSVSAVAVARPADRDAQAVQQGSAVRLLTRHSDAAAAGASAPSSFTASRAAAATAPLPQASTSSSPVDDDEDDDIDFVAIVNSCCLASEEDSKAEGSGYRHLDLIRDIVRS